MPHVILLSASQDIYEGNSGLGSTISNGSTDWSTTLPASTEFRPVQLSTKSLIILLSWGMLILCWTIFIFVKAFDKGNDQKLKSKLILKLSNELLNFKNKLDEKLIGLRLLLIKDLKEENRMNLKLLNLKHQHQNTTDLDCRCMGAAQA
ncbi:uncharacterized protein MELLADRAFT_101431 [Melampsora larici-populina 98AG31]|uniref:Uncharacterized protein n=1 Tax=Melampsora larici-populina (strain 98AG31 / pathotype 3-4-7) TaxID=747676 RepID=F4R4Q5_MELLP|nr:uncharacterized protein MELLADRAFT_101431 [Melampsora larici-populina 98AG31]EGG12958.1 hypothetical protein MELLADRAFT_101431 [Melampsora larici-populina 98AG31]